MMKHVEIEILHGDGSSYGLIVVATDLDPSRAADALAAHAELSGWDIQPPVRGRFARNDGAGDPEYTVTDEGVEEWWPDDGC